MLGGTIPDAMAQASIDDASAPVHDYGDVFLSLGPWTEGIAPSFPGLSIFTRPPELARHRGMNSG